jgi:hypothetical protein
VESFLQVYPQYIEQVRPELNGLFREDDYPAADKLRKKFGVKLEILPIPTGNDFRVQMSAEEQARVAREIDANVRQSLTRGTEDLWKRLREVVSHMVDRLNEPESRFHATLVTNVFDLVELLPRLNVNGDAELNRLAEQIRHRWTHRRVCIDLHFEAEEGKHHFPAQAKWSRVHRWGCGHFHVGADLCANLELREGGPKGPVLNEHLDIGHFKDCKIVWLVKPGPEPYGQR